MNSLELFAGAGGLAIGVAQAGFHHIGVFEFDKESCKTLTTNINKPDWNYDKWPIIQEDVKKIDYSLYNGKVQLISGGPPCQPFSLGGKHLGYKDKRDLFPEAARAVKEVQPYAFIFENVRGLLRKTFSTYFEYIILRLSYPEITIKVDEEWKEHLARLERHHTHGKYKGLHYNVVFQLLNAADYGVPQKRERVFIVGFRGDIENSWNYPLPTHSESQLRISQWITGEYWEEHEIPKKYRPIPNEKEKFLISQKTFSPTFRWNTVRDAFSNLPNPRTDESDIPNHEYQPGARIYKGHTGSVYDEPSKTLKAGDHGVPGGENTIKLQNGRVRYYTVRESARLQTFPDLYYFPSSWTESMRQIGNAVPVSLAKIVAKSVKLSLEKSIKKRNSRN